MARAIVGAEDMARRRRRGREELTNGNDALRRPSGDRAGAKLLRAIPSAWTSKHSASAGISNALADKVGGQVGEHAVVGDAVEVLDGEGAGSRAGHQADHDHGDQPVAGGRRVAQRPRQPAGPVGPRPELGQGHQRGRGAERHLEPGLQHRLRLDEQDHQGRERQGMQADRSSIGEDGQEGDAGGDDAARRAGGWAPERIR